MFWHPEDVEETLNMLGADEQGLPIADLILKTLVLL